MKLLSLKPAFFLCTFSAATMHVMADTPPLELDSIAQDSFVKEITSFEKSAKVKKAFEVISALEPETRSNHILSFGTTYDGGHSTYRSDTQTQCQFNKCEYTFIARYSIHYDR